MKIEDGFLVVERGEDAAPLKKVESCDQYLHASVEWRLYPGYAHGATFGGSPAGFSIRRPIANCSTELLALAGYTNESIHF